MSREECRAPSLRDLGPDLTHLSPQRRLLALALPFFWCGLYFAFAALGWWPVAVVALVCLSFVTYGSVSHDLVHRNLGLSKRTNDVLLSVIELLALRSGHAYQAAHLHHHARYPHPDDVEAVASRYTGLGALADGLVLQFRIYRWALTNARHAQLWIIAEGIACLLLVGIAVVLLPLTPVFFVYVALITAGSWVIPLVTSYVPHDPHGQDELSQTRLFRGKVASLIALEHLYHLEHHLYPSVPHQNWPALAKRLDPFFERAGVKAVKF